MRRLRLSSDYSAEWPLWSGGMVDAAALGLPDDLCADLRAWQALFDAGFDPDTGWREGSTEERYAHAAADLLHRLRSALGPGTEVTLDPWPVQNPALIRRLEHRLR